jgi:hypothetical protein
MKDTKARYVEALDRIIEKYTATPRDDPEFVDYAMRPYRKLSRRRQCCTRRSSSACASRRSR